MFVMQNDAKDVTLFYGKTLKNHMTSKSCGYQLKSLLLWHFTFLDFLGNFLMELLNLIT